jgi:acyl-CoA reductase-like NAD-dependent aldehyde dehydrogenase
VASVNVSPLINGALLDSDGDALFDVINPANGRRLLSIPAGTANDVDRATAAARVSFDDGRWSEAPASFRKKTLRWSDLIAAEAAALDVLDAEEMGKPISAKYCNGAAAAGFVRFQAEAIDKVAGDVYPSDKGSFVTQRRVPRGVVAAVVPWNFPTYCAVLKLAPALAAGNCVVLKPSEMSSRSAIRLAQLAHEAGLPAGVLNVVPGLGETVGRALGLHMDVDMMTFTGSTSVGKKMLEYAGQSNMKVVMAECGGKSPQIVFGDGVDLDAAADAIAGLLLTNQGQICSVGSRLLVARSVEDELLAKIAVRMQRIVMGDPLARETTFGPIASERQCRRVMQYIAGAQEEEATLVCGGHRVRESSGGYFVEPTVFRNVAPSARIAREEIFGPVLSTIAFDDDADAIRIANGTPYGLAAYVWTSNLTTGMRMARGVRASVIINSAPSIGEGAGYAMSSEPIGQSGIGTEGGLAGLESYMRRHLVRFNHA